MLIKKLAFLYVLPFVILTAFIFSLPSPAIAEPRTADRNTSASFFHVASTGLVVYGKGSTGEKTVGGDASHAVSIPLNHDLNAFVDFARPVLQDNTRGSSVSDFRTLFGFHITLK